MKKVFVTLLILMLIIVTAAPYFAAILFDVPSDILNTLHNVRIILNYILIASCLAWAAGLFFGMLLGRLSFYRVFLTITNSVAILPAFILTLVISFIFDFSFRAILSALFIPLFFRILNDCAECMAKYKECNYKVHSLALSPSLYFRRYTAAQFISPMFISLLRALRSASISMAFLSFTGVLFHFDTLTLYTLIFGGLVFILLINTLCYIIPESKGGRTWLIRL